MGGAASGLTTVLGGIGGFWVMSVGPTVFVPGATVFTFGSAVFTLGVTVFALGVAGLALGVTGLALGVTGLALGIAGLALGTGLALGATVFALGAGLALGAARCAKHTPVSKPSSIPPTISFLMPFCLRSEGRMSFAKVRMSSESMFDFR